MIFSLSRFCKYGKAEKGQAHPPLFFRRPADGGRFAAIPAACALFLLGLVVLFFCPLPAMADDVMSVTRDRVHIGTDVSSGEGGGAAADSDKPAQREETQPMNISPEIHVHVPWQGGAPTHYPGMRPPPYPGLQQPPSGMRPPYPGHRPPRPGEMPPASGIRPPSSLPWPPEANPVYPGFRPPHQGRPSPGGVARPPAQTTYPAQRPPYQADQRPGHDRYPGWAHPPGQRPPQGWGQSPDAGRRAPFSSGQAPLHQGNPSPPALP